MRTSDMNASKVLAWFASITGVIVLAAMDREVFTAGELVFRGLAIGAVAAGS